jgi:hypothetical protein
MRGKLAGWVRRLIDGRFVNCGNSVGWVHVQKTAAFVLAWRLGWASSWSDCRRSIAPICEAFYFGFTCISHFAVGAPGLIWRASLLAFRNVLSH